MKLPPDTSRTQPFAVVHPDGRRTDKELFEPMLGEDRWPEDVDYGPKTPEKTVQKRHRPA
jgi:hypothetical protein